MSKEDIRREAKKLGFDGTRFTKAELPEFVAQRLDDFLEQNFEGQMSWLRETRDRRISPDAMWPEARSAIVLAMNYGPDHNPMEMLQRRSLGNISVYARNRDYHDVMKGRLKELAQKVASRNGCGVKVFVDTAPLMEKPLAHQAGLGWQGKHTNLVSRKLGSWFFLGVVLMDGAFDPDPREEDHCGSCRACLDICPTNAFPAAYRLDARRCISYLTIEHSGMIPVEFRRAMGNRIYGCDDCLAVCPWNKFAEKVSEMKLVAREDLKQPGLKELLSLDDASFRKLFSGSPVKRIGRNRFIRNVLIASGNSGDSELIAAVKPHLLDHAPLIRAMAVWAIRQLVKDTKEFQKLRDKHIQGEPDQVVMGEWN